MTKPADFDAYWEQMLAELAAVPAAPELEVNAIRTTDFATCYHLTLTSSGPYRLYAYYSVPRGAGPFPAILHAPAYASVVGPPPYYEREKHVALSLCSRGQRLSDRPYAAAYPGHLTVGIEDPRNYVYRGVVADTVRAIDFLFARREVDFRQILVAGPDTALIGAALRPQVRAVVAGGLMFYNARAFAPDTSAYPVEELNDYRRTFPDREEAMWRTLSYFDPIHFAPRITADVMLCVGGAGAQLNRQTAEPLAAAILGAVDVDEATGYGLLDHRRIDHWRERHLGLA